MKMPGANRSAALAVLALISISGGLRADSLGCAPGSRPVIEALGFFSATSLSPQPGVLPDWREAIQVCQDHRLLGSILQSAAQTEVPAAGVITRGRIAAASWTELATASRAAQIGLLHSCRLAVQPELRVTVDFTWHGAGTRINKFRVSTNDEGQPPCPAAANDLWQALFGVDLEPGADTVEIP